MTLCARLHFFCKAINHTALRLFANQAFGSPLATEVAWHPYSEELMQTTRVACIGTHWTGNESDVWAWTQTHLEDSSRLHGGLWLFVIAFEHPTKKPCLRQLKSAVCAV